MDERPKIFLNIERKNRIQGVSVVRDDDPNPSSASFGMETLDFGGPLSLSIHQYILVAREER